jgi:predicted transcriptional regulator
MNNLSLHDFSLWAFGKDYQKLKPHQFVPRWNIRHGKKYHVYDASDQQKVLQKMKAIWLDTVGKESKKVKK